MNLWVFYPVLISFLFVIAFLLRQLNYERKEREYLIKQHQQLATAVRYNHLQAEMEGKISQFSPSQWEQASSVGDVEGEVY
jgi:hypothetical protein